MENEHQLKVYHLRSGYTGRFVDEHGVEWGWYSSGDGNYSVIVMQIRRAGARVVEPEAYHLRCFFEDAPLYSPTGRREYFNKYGTEGE